MLEFGIVTFDIWFQLALPVSRAGK